MTDKIEQMLLMHDRAVTAAGKSYYGQISSVTREETTQQLTALLDTEIAKARYNELTELNWQIAKNDWTGPRAYHMFGYIADRLVELADTESNKEGVEVNE